MIQKFTCEYSRLLYHCLGGGDERGKLAPLLDPNSSLVSQVMANMTLLIKQWTEIPSSANPWLILRAMRAPMLHQQFAKSSRGKGVRLISAANRRWNLKFTAYPFPLWALGNNLFTLDEQAQVATNLLKATTKQVDSYAGAVRRKWPTLEKLLSPSVAFMVQTDLDLHPIDTGHIERLNSELVLQSNSGRAPGRSSVQTFRENLLAQTCAVPH